MSGLLQVQPKDLNYPDARNHFLTKLRYILPLYTGGKLTEYARISAAMARMSRYDRLKVLSMKRFQVKKTFFDITLVENYIRNLGKIIGNIKHLKRVVQEMKKEGYAQAVDVMEVDARLAEAQSMYNQARLNRALAYQFLSFLLNRDVESIVRVDEFASMPKITPQLIERKNLDIQKALLGLRISQMAIDVEKANFKPTLGAFAEYGSADNVLWNDFFKKDFYTVGMQLQWNLFNGGIDRVNLEKAKLRYLMTNDQVALAKKGTMLKVNKLKTEIKSIEADIKSYQKQLAFAHRVYATYRAKYQEGLVSISDLLIKQSKELEMMLKLLTAKNRRNTKVFELQSLINEGGEV